MAIAINGSGTITGITAGGLPDATITSAELASNAVTTAKITDANVTQAKLETLCVPLGVGQTWTNVAASRAFATTYTNSTGRPIFVYVQSTGASSSMTATVAGVIVAGANTTSTASVVYFIVPSGATYVVAQVGGVSIVRWAELR